MATYVEGKFGISFKTEEEIGLQWYRSMDGLSEEQEERLYEEQAVNREECASDWFVYDPKTDEWTIQWNMWEVNQTGLDRMNQVHPNFPDLGAPKWYTHEWALFEQNDQVYIFLIKVEDN